MSKNTGFEFEHKFFDNLKKLLETAERTELNLKFRESHAKVASYSSISFGGNSAEIQIEEKPKSGARFGVKKLYRKTLDELNISFKDLKSSNYLYVSIASPDDVYLYKELFCNIYDDMFLKLSADSFYCCSRYMECSDKKQCVNPSKKLSRACRYRKNLEQGIIFFGKNRNLILHS